MTQGYGPISAGRSPHHFEVISGEEPRASAWQISPKKAAAVIAALCLVGSIGFMAPSTVISEVAEEGSSGSLGHGKFDAKGRAVLENYDTSRTFASFLPAIAGEYGTPMWAFFVNRGQGITSYGSGNKDTAMLEFNSANKAYEYVSSDGFRTFVKGTRSGHLAGKGTSFAKEPFSPTPLNRADSKRTMFVGMNEVEVQEEDSAHGLTTSALYFTVPGEKFGALVRRATFTNTGDSNLELEVLDGQTKVEPAGVNDWNLKNMGRTVEAWMNVYNVKDSVVGKPGKDNTEPYFKLSMSLADTAEVSQIAEGHWAIAFLEDEHAAEKAAAKSSSASSSASSASRRLAEQAVAEASGQATAAKALAKLPFVVDPNVMFGMTTSLEEPTRFWAQGKGSQSSGKGGAGGATGLATGPQITTSKTPCAFAAASLTLRPGESRTVTTVYGRVSSAALYDSGVKDVVAGDGWVAQKYDDANELIERLTDKVAMKSGVPVFDAYVRQQYLDNLLRGGYPVVLGGDGSDPKIFHTFSRIHGDLERDYNYFQIDACFFSMGPGNFRDVNQNRRDDCKQEPRVGFFNAAMFLSLVQADGYNPLTVNSVFFVLPDASLDPATAEAMAVQADDDTGSSNGGGGDEVADDNANATAAIAAATASPTAVKIASQVCTAGSDQAVVAALLSNTAGYRPGDLFIALDVHGVSLSVSDEEFIDLVTAEAQVDTSARFNQNGFWADHWTYHLDLVESFLTVYPDMEHAALFGKLGATPFFMSPVSTYPRSQKYVLAPKLGPRQYNFIYQDKEKQAAMAKAAKASGVAEDANWQHAASTGEVFKVSAFTKLLMLATTKFTLLDPAGMGVEYEGGKPGWNDAMNGLCGLFGSGLPEAYETIRIFQFLQEKATAHAEEAIQVPAEMDTLLRTALRELATLDAAGDDDAAAAFTYWDKVRTAVEAYREATRVTFSGEVVEWRLGEELSPLLEAFTAKMQAGAAKATELYGQVFEKAQGVTPTYWYFDVDAHELLGGKDELGRHYVAPTAFSPQPVPVFLEGPVRQLKTVASKAEAKAIYDAVKASDLHDKELGMYAISASLQGMSFEIGRMMAFAPGWLENQSIWLHMSYKYYLELLRTGLYEEVFAEFKTGMVAFMDPKVYGRSPLECSSFIASSAHPDKSIHGQGYLARLSGSTAELLSMWNLMMMGPAPFAVNAESGDLELALRPILPGDWFDKHGEVSFTFLGQSNVTYHNPSKLDSWDEALSVEKVTVTLADGSTAEIEGGVVPAQYASAARTGGVEAIDVFFSK